MAISVQTMRNPFIKLGVLVGAGRLAVAAC